MFVANFLSSHFKIILSWYPEKPCFGFFSLNNALNAIKDHFEPKLLIKTIFELNISIKNGVRYLKPKHTLNQKELKRTDFFDKFRIPCNN